MLCAISGEAPQAPVASLKSGNVFEKRLIEQYIAENGTDPVTGEELSAEDLVELKAARVVKPRPPTLTSIPSLLSVFQNEWDALALESYTLKQHLSQLRQELSTALYNNDAAVRVIARLTKERDEARDALAKVSLSDRRVAASSGDSMQIDGNALPDSVAERVDATQAALSKTRRKRAVPEDWATSDDVESFDSALKPTKLVPPTSHAMALDKSKGIVLVGGSDGAGSAFSIAKKKVTYKFEAGSAINDILSVDLDGQQLAVAGTAAGEVLIISDGKPTASFKEHAGPVSALALHPCGDVLLSVGQDGRFFLYDLRQQVVISRLSTDNELYCCQFHPDGHIFAVGGKDGQIKAFETKTVTLAASLPDAGPIKAISFSENGTWVASIVEGATSATIWDLRKQASVHTADFGGAIDCIEWDYTGQFLAGAGPGGVTVQRYDKSAKAWSQPLMKAVPGTSLHWGAQAKSLVLLSPEGTLNVLQAQ